MWTQIPKMDPVRDPLSRGWHQPNADELLIDDTHVIMTRKFFDQLHDYSLSQPTGAYQGKMWKKQRWEVEERDGQRYRKWLGIWVLCWFGPHPDPGYVSNNYREILFID